VAAAPRVPTIDPQQRRKMIIAVTVLWVVTLASALGVIYSTHVSRKLMNELEVKRRTTADLHIEWGQYLLEQSAWAAYTQVEARAGSELHMSLPPQEKIVVLRRQ